MSLLLADREPLEVTTEGLREKERLIPLRGRIIRHLQVYLADELDFVGRTPERDDFLLYPEKRTPDRRVYWADPKKRCPRTRCTAGGTECSSRLASSAMAFDRA